jgi:dihydrofolate reductase
MKPFKAIAAVAENGVIGRGNTIPWHLPEDFKFFKTTTMGHLLLMGRKTFESIGRPLPGRTTIVLSRAGFSHPGVQVISSLDQVPDPGDRELFVCGGAELYRQALPLCSELFLTRVFGNFDGDTFFPPFEHLFSRSQSLQKTGNFEILKYYRE